MSPLQWYEHQRSTNLGRDFYLHREQCNSDPVLGAKNGFIFPSFGGVTPGMSILGADSYSTKIGASLVFNFNYITKSSLSPGFGTS